MLVPFFSLLAGATPVGATTTATPTAGPATATTAAPPSLARQTTVLGRAFGLSFSSAANAAQTGISTALNATILGAKKSLVQTSVQPSADFSTGQFQVYINGIQVGTSQGAIAQANWSQTVQIPPLNVKATIVTIPIGPLVIEVDGGYSLTGELSTALQLELAAGAPTTVAAAGAASSVQATLGTQIQAAGFIDGSVGLIIIRGGVQGQIDVADGAINTKADLYLGKTPPAFTATGSIGFFSGALSAFAEYWALFAGWHRFWSATLFSWNGVCFDFQNGVQAGGKCAVR